MPRKKTKSLRRRPSPRNKKSLSPVAFNSVKFKTPVRRMSRDQISKSMSPIKPPKIMSPYQRTIRPDTYELFPIKDKKDNKNFQLLFDFLTNLQKRKLIEGNINSFIDSISMLFPLSELTYIKKGMYGIVFAFQDKVIKITLNNQKEFILHSLLDKTGIAPKIFQYYTIKNISIMVMEKINGFLETYLETQRTPEEIHQISLSIEQIITTLCENNILHGDFHIGNFAITEYVDEDNEVFVLPVLIDFGFSDYMKCVPMFEVIQLLRTLDPYFNKDINFKNRVMLQEELIILFYKYSGVYLPKNWSVYETIFKHLYGLRQHPDFSTIVNTYVKKELGKVFER